LFDKRNFSAAAPALESLLARDRVVYIAKVLEPNESIQMIASRKAFPLSVPMLVQTTAHVVRDPDVQCRATFIGENIDPVIVAAHVFEQ